MMNTNIGYVIAVVVGFLLGALFGGGMTIQGSYWKRQELYDHCIEFNTHEVCADKAMTTYPLNFKKKS